MNTTTLGSLSLHAGSVKSLWQPEVLRAMKTAPQSLVGFLHSGGRWNSQVDRCFWTEAELRPTRYGKFTEDGSWVSPFHQAAGELEPFDLENVYSGRAMFVPGGKDARRIFQNVIWGIWHEPTDVQTAMMNALLMAQSRSQSPHIHLVLPWFGQLETMPAPFDSPFAERWHNALLWTERQMKGIREAAKRMEKPFHLSVLMNPPVSENDVNWFDAFSQKAGELGLDGVLRTSLGMKL